MKLKYLLLTSIAVGTLATAHSFAETLTDSIDYAIRTNPSIHESRANIAAIYDELRQAYGRSRPQVSVSADTGWEVVDADGARYSTAMVTGDDQHMYDSGSSQLWRSDASVKLTQNIFDGGDRKSEKQRQAARVDASAIRLKERSEFIGVQVAYAYLEILRQQETLDLAAQNVATHRAIVDQVSSLGSRTASAADVAQANSRLSRAEDTYTLISQELESQAISFENLVGRKPGNLVKPTIKRSDIPSTLDEAVNLAVIKNPTVQYAKADIDVSKAELKATEASFYPTLDFELEAGLSSNAGGDTGTDRNASAMLVMNWDVYTGGIREARNSEYRNRVNEKIEIMKGTERTAVEEVKKTWDLLLRTDVRIEALTNEVQYAKEVVATYREEFDAGTRDLLDVLQAENDLFVAHSNLIEGKYSVIYNRYRLLAATGSLLDYLGIIPMEDAFYNERNETGIAYTDDLRRKDARMPHWTDRNVNGKIRK
ncbi:MAG: TolC family outer membrane protein [Alphaproteobacteria bacterium]